MNSSKRWCNISLLVVILCLAAGHAGAGIYTWTNSVSGSSGYWTNSTNWKPNGVPCQTVQDNVYLTNQVAGSYTCTLDSSPAFSVGYFALSNALGSACLRVTNSSLAFASGYGIDLGNGGVLEVDNGGSVTVPAATWGWSGSNVVILLNQGGTLSNSGALTFGGSPGATETFASASATGGVWNLNGSGLTLGVANSTNLLVMNNVTMTNEVGNVYIGNGANNSFGWVLSNGACFYGNIIANLTSRNYLNVGGLGSPSTFAISGGNVTLGSASTGSRVTITNGTLSSTIAFYVGSGVSTNIVMTIRRGGSCINAGASGGLYVGNGSSVDSEVIVNGDGVANGASVIFTGASSAISILAGSSNTLSVLNGGLLYMPNTVTVGSSNNNYNVGGSGLSSTVTNLKILATGVGCKMTVTNATLVTSAFSVAGYGNSGSPASNNTFEVDAGGNWYAGNFNTVVYAGTLPIVGGTGGGPGNVVFINGGLVECGGLAAGNAAGNLVTNFGGVYQFNTATPIVTNGAGGSGVAINNGWVSFKGVTNADILCNQTGKTLESGTRMVWYGNNAFRLNNSTNGGGSGANSQTYTFNTGSAANFAGLELFNGNTAYTNGAVTIGANGWLTYSNTAAIMWGAVTNSGTMTLRSSQVTFTNGLALKGGGTLLWATNSSINVHGVMTLPTSLVVSNTSSMGLSDTPTLLTADGGFGSSSPGGWTVYPNNHKVTISGDGKSLIYSTRQPGFLFYVH